MICPICLKEIDDDSLICPICGEKVETNNEVQKLIDSNQKESNMRHVLFICLIVAAVIGIIVLLCVTGVIWWIIGIAVVIFGIVIWLNS